MKTDADAVHMRVSRSTAVIETVLPGELILLDPSSGEMFSLNHTGQFVWERLDELAPEEIAAQLADSFGIEPARAQADVQTLVADLIRTGLVEAGGKGGS